MSTNRRSLIFSLILLLAGAAGTCAADLLKAIPDTALVVVVINRLEATSDKIERIAGLVSAPQQSLLTLFRVQTGIYQGLDEKGSAALAILSAPVEGAMPQGVVLLPVTDYPKFLAQLQPDDATGPIASIRLAGKPMFVGKHGEFAALADADAKGALENLLGSKKDISHDLEPLADWLGQVDAGAAVTPAGIKYGVDMVRQFLPLIRLSVGGLGGQQSPQAQQAQQSAAGILDLVEGFIDPLASNVTQFGLGLGVDEKSNLRISKRVQFAAEGDWSKAAAATPAFEDGGLAGLPAEPFGMVFSTMFPKALREALGGQIANLMKLNPAQAQLPAEQQAALSRAALAMLAPIERSAMLMGTGKPGEPLYAHTIGLAKVDDAAKYVGQYAEAVKLLGSSLKNPQAPSVGYEVNKIDVGGVAALEVITDLTGLNQKGVADVKPVFEKLFGSSDKARFYVAAADETTVVMAYISVDNLKRALAAVKSKEKGLAADPQIAETAALLPKGAQLLIYAHPRGLLDMSTAMLTAVPGAPLSWLQRLLYTPASGRLQLPAAADAPATPPLGIALVASAAGLNAELIAPSATLEAIGQIVAKIRGQQ